MNDRQPDINTILDHVGKTFNFVPPKLMDSYRRYMSMGAPKGIVSPATLDMSKRPVVKNPDGTVSNLRTMSFGADGVEILIPTVREDGTVMTPDEAIQHYYRTGEHLGTFASPDDAIRYAEQLHNKQEKEYVGSGGPRITGRNY